MQVSIAGSTGSIGTQAIDVALSNPDRFEVVAIGARASVKALIEQAQLLRPRVVAIADETKAAELSAELDSSVELRVGKDSLASLGIDNNVDVVVNAVVGFAGLPVTLSALQNGKRLALANKESLVAGGPLVARVRETPGAQLLPVDSEHGAIHQCLRAETSAGNGDNKRVSRLIVTASGGPFRGKTIEELRNVTVAEALAHPTWKMGPKITIDSSTLFNKGLEVIEAHELFGIDYENIDVVVHPQSIVHSAVEFCDGSTIAQLSCPDMRLPIGYAMGYPDRLLTPYGRLDWANLATLNFEAPDVKTFRALPLAYEVGKTGGTAPAVFNAANEVAVEAFLRGSITWMEIATIIEETIHQSQIELVESVEALIEHDSQARVTAGKMIIERN